MTAPGPNRLLATHEDLARKSDVGHDHVPGDVDGLPAALAERPTSDQVDLVVQAAVAALVGSAPETLDTLDEIARALGDDPNFATTITNLIATKAPADHTHARMDAAPATWHWAGTTLPTSAAAVHAQARVGDFIVAPNLTTDPGWHRITGV